MRALSPTFSKLLGAGVVANMAYGGYLGFAAQPRTPTSMADATAQANPGTMARHAAIDVGVSLIDDALLFAGMPLVTKLWPGLRKPFAVGAYGVAILGGGVASAILGHEIHNFQAARDYIHSHGDVPDHRINPIEGFRGQSIRDQQRALMTGIASPASQGLFYRMNNNPLASLNTSFLHPEHKNEDTFARVFRFGTAAGAVASMLTFSRLGYGRALELGAAAALGAGYYGAASSSGTPQEKFGAMAALGLSIAPMFAGGGLLLGARSLGHLPGAAGRASGALDQRLNQAAGWLYNIGDKGLMHSNVLMQQITSQGVLTADRVDRAVAMGAIPVGSAVRKGSIFATGFFHGFDSRFSRNAARFFSARGANADVAIPDAAGKMARSIVQGLSTTASVGVDILYRGGAQLVKHSGHELGGTHGATRWEQSLALSHLAIVVPHTIYATDMVSGGHSRRARRRHATTTMPSNG